MFGGRATPYHLEVEVPTENVLPSTLMTGIVPLLTVQIILKLIWQKSKRAIKRC